jgi:hypothetical protein
MTVSTLAPTGPPCLLLTGVPRSGTTLCCELLNSLPNVRALDEPLPMRELLRAARGEDGAIDVELVCDGIAHFAVEQRRSLLTEGTVVSKHVDGAVSGSRRVAAVRDVGGTRRSQVELGTIELARPRTADFTLAIKHPVVFTALLDGLRRHFAVYAVVRNPLAVLGSWESVPWPTLREGRLGIPEMLAPVLTRKLALLDDALERRIELLSWHYERYASTLARDHVIRYEDLIASGGAALSAIAPEAAALDVVLQDNNAAAVYDRAHLREVGRRLIERERAPWRAYYPHDVEHLLETLGE